jgi:hypothetical protein
MQKNAVDCRQIKTDFLLRQCVKPAKIAVHSAVKMAAARTDPAVGVDPVANLF